MLSDAQSEMLSSDPVTPMTAAAANGTQVPRSMADSFAIPTTRSMDGTAVLICPQPVSRERIIAMLPEATIRDDSFINHYQGGLDD